MVKVILRPFGLCASAAGLVLINGGVSHAGSVPNLGTPGLVGNFEDATLDEWGTDGGPGTPTLAQSTTGVTLGASSLASSAAQGAFWGPATGNLVPNYVSALETATTLSYDLTLNSASINGGSGSFNGFAQDNALAITLFGNGGTTNIFSQEAFSAAGISDSSGENAEWNGVNGTRHLVWNLSDFTGTDSFTGFTGTIAQILAQDSGIVDAKIAFVEQTGNSSGTVGPATFFFDDVQLSPVPEPASLSLLSLGIPALLMRRRKLV